MGAGIDHSLNTAMARLRDAHVFSSVDVRGSVLHCVSASQPDAAFRVYEDEKGVWVAWVSADRYLSQSIEADLMWTGDDLGELIAEEIGDRGYPAQRLGQVEHFRDAEKLFTFRTRIAERNGPIVADEVVVCLLGYAAAFAGLGDMKAEES